MTISLPPSSDGGAHGQHDHDAICGAPVPITWLIRSASAEAEHDAADELQRPLAVLPCEAPMAMIAAIEAKIGCGPR